MAKTKTKTKKPRPTPDLRRVREGFYLQWPSNVAGAASATGRARGPAGYVVDLNAPLEREWCAGQMHKLEKAPRGSKVNSIDSCPSARRMRLQFIEKNPDWRPEIEREKPASVKDAKTEAKASEPAPDNSGAMPPEGTPPSVETEAAVEAAVDETEAKLDAPAAPAPDTPAAPASPAPDGQPMTPEFGA